MVRIISGLIVIAIIIAGIIAIHKARYMTRWERSTALACFAICMSFTTSAFSDVAMFGKPVMKVLAVIFGVAFVVYYYRHDRKPSQN